MATKKKRKAAAKIRSGTVWGDADYKQAGYERLTLRPPAGFLAALEALAAAREVTRTQAVVDAVTEALERERRGM